MKANHRQARSELALRHFHLCVVVLLGIFLQACIAPSNMSDPGDRDGLGGTGIIADRDGIGGTGVVADSDGIGGTGHRGDEDGIGGSGLWDQALGTGDVAIIGIMSGSNTLVVNGHGMFYSAATKVTLNGVAVTRDGLLPGQVVAVRAGLVDGLIVAKSIKAEDAVLGRITSIAGDGRSLMVLGQRVHISDATKLATDATLKVGDAVRVSGLRRLDASIDASLVHPTTLGARSFTSGFAVRGDRGVLRIGNLDVGTLANVELQQNLIVSGQWVDGEFEVENVRARANLPFADEVDYYSIQAYASADPIKHELRFGSYPTALQATQGIALSLMREQRVILNITAPSAASVRLDRIAPSPVSAPDLLPMIPRYSPDLMRLEVPIAPGLPSGNSSVEPVINVPQRSDDVDRLIPQAPRVQVNPRPAPIRAPIGPRIDVTPKAVTPRVRVPRVPPVVVPPVGARPVLPRPQIDLAPVGP